MSISNKCPASCICLPPYTGLIDPHQNQQAPPPILSCLQSAKSLREKDVQRLSQSGPERQTMEIVDDVFGELQLQSQREPLLRLGHFDSSSDQEEGSGSESDRATFYSFGSASESLADEPTAPPAAPRLRSSSSRDSSSSSSTSGHSSFYSIDPGLQVPAAPSSPAALTVGAAASAASSGELGSEHLDESDTERKSDSEQSINKRYSADEIERGLGRCLAAFFEVFDHVCEVFRLANHMDLEILPNGERSLARLQISGETVVLRVDSREKKLFLTGDSQIRAFFEKRLTEFLDLDLAKWVVTSLIPSECTGLELTRTEAGPYQFTFYFSENKSTHFPAEIQTSLANISFGFTMEAGLTISGILNPQDRQFVITDGIILGCKYPQPAWGMGFIYSRLFDLAVNFIPDNVRGSVAAWKNSGFVNDLLARFTKIGFRGRDQSVDVGYSCLIGTKEPLSPIRFEWVEKIRPNKIPEFFASMKW